MDIDALARDVVDGFARNDFAGPPFPPYFVQRAERVRAQAEDANAQSEALEAPEDAWPAFESFDQVEHLLIGDLDVYLYRMEPTASALLLVLRGDSLAYTSFAGGRFMMPPRENERFPPFDLAMMATVARAEGELGLPISSMSSGGDEPVQVVFEIEPDRYAALDDGARRALHDACTPIARDTALLFCGRSGPLTIAFHAPDPPAVGNVQHIGTQREAIAQFDVP
jgi:hypothetical protein